MFTPKRPVVYRSVACPRALFNADNSALQRIEKKLDMMELKMNKLTTDIAGLKTEYSGLKGIVVGAVAINAGAYLGPIFAFVALGNAVGFFDKLK